MFSMMRTNLDANAVCFMIPPGAADAALSLLVVAGVAARAGVWWHEQHTRKCRSCEPGKPAVLCDRS